MKPLTQEQRIGMALAYRKMTLAGLARAIGTSSSNLGQKLKRGTVSEKEFEAMAAELSCKFVNQFVFKDRTITAPTNAQIVEVSLAYRDMTKQQLAADIDQTPSNLVQKLASNTLNQQEMYDIAAALGGEYVTMFDFPGELTI